MFYNSCEQLSGSEEQQRQVALIQHLMTICKQEKEEKKAARVIALRMVFVKPFKWIAAKMTNYRSAARNPDNYDLFFPALNAKAIAACNIARHGSTEKQKITAIKRLETVQSFCEKFLPYQIELDYDPLRDHDHAASAIGDLYYKLGNYKMAFYWYTMCKDDGYNNVREKLQALSQKIDVELKDEGIKFVDSLYKGLSDKSKKSEKGELLRDIKGVLATDKDFTREELMVIIKSVVTISLQRNANPYSPFKSTTSALLAERLLSDNSFPALKVQIAEDLELPLNGKLSIIRYRNLKHFAGDRDFSTANKDENLAAAKEKYQSLGK